ncbi:MAG: mismatch-specific DNA-glycosylase [Methanobacteriota archaeon]
MRAYCRRCDRAVDAVGDWPGRCGACRGRIEEAPLADVVAPRLRTLFVGINPGIETARRRHHFANPGNPFWRLLSESALTPRLLRPDEERAMLALGLGLTNVVSRATAGAADLVAEDVRRGRERFAILVRRVRPRGLAFVGKQPFRMALARRGPVAHGEVAEPYLGAGCFVLPSTSPANAAVPYREKLLWFRRLSETLKG